MTLRGTQVIYDENDILLYNKIIETCKNNARAFNYKEIIIPQIWDAQTFIDKAGLEIKNQMYIFNDKKDREICLIPEVTGIIQKLYCDTWQQSAKKPVMLFYLSRCYRYERPQAGRYREFTQFGIEHLGGKQPEDKELIMQMLLEILQELNVSFKLIDSVKRGLSYYTEDGFEIECETLGAQKQIAGGGRYNEGIGWAIGIERLMLALKNELIK